MSENMTARLREGIDAAKRGDKIAARRLLQQVLSLDGNNELALMWMASVVDTLNERRFYLERALQINPNNNRAREALKRLGGESAGAASAPPRSQPALATGDYMRETSARGTNMYLVAAAVVAFIVIAVVVGVLVTAQRGTTGSATATPNVQATFAAILNPSNTPPPTRSMPTETVLAGIVVTLDPNLLTPLPPTFTPTPTLPPTETPAPTATPLPLNTFTIVYSDFDQGAADPSLYRGSADGTGEIKLAAGDMGGYRDVALSADGRQIAFVREVASEEGRNRPQLFIAPVSSPEDVTKLTSMTGSSLTHPAWSPDGRRIVFSSNQDGDEEIYTVNASGGTPLQVTRNSSRDVDPSFSPDGSKIIFASDLDSPGFSEIYSMNTDGSNLTQLTNDAQSSYSPVWSPDGARIAFVSDRGSDGDIYVADADGQRPFLLTQDDNGAEDRTPAWSPDGNWIIFASNREDDVFRWYAVNLQGDVQPVTENERNPQSLSFSTR